MPTMPARMSGFLLCFICSFFLIGTVPYFFRPKPFDGGSLKKAQATIVSQQPGMLRQFPSSYNGVYYSYSFPDSSGENQKGQFFSRSSFLNEHQVGERIEVEYREGKPWINRRLGDAPPDFLFLQALACLFGTGLVVGIIMLCTGRDFIADWKKHRA